MNHGQHYSLRPMTKGGNMGTQLDPDLFARIMELAPAIREDVLEFLGSTAIDKDDVEALIAEIKSRHNSTD